MSEKYYLTIAHDGAVVLDRAEMRKKNLKSLPALDRKITASVALRFNSHWTPEEIVDEINDIIPGHEVLAMEGVGSFETSITGPQINGTYKIEQVLTGSDAA